MGLLKSLLLFSHWLVQVFTWAKSFRSNRIIGNRLLNRLGLHVFRVVVSHALFNFRLWLLFPLVDRRERRAFREHGFILIPDFLPAEEFASLLQEMTGYVGAVREEIEGDTLTQRIYLTRDELAKLPACRRVSGNSRLLRLLRYTSSKNRIPFFHIENLYHHANPIGGHDPQKDMHADTFHPCVKAWLYVDDVTDENGPFVFVPGSHRLTWKRMKWEYRESLKACEKAGGRDPGRYWDGSFRVNEEDLREMGCQEPRPMRVSANTLLIGNTYGFHRRGDAQPGAVRMTLWMQARDNPFNPLFTPFPSATARVFEWVWARYMKTRTVKQIKAGQWRLREGGFSRPEAK